MNKTLNVLYSPLYKFFIPVWGGREKGQLICGASQQFLSSFKKRVCEFFMLCLKVAER